MEEKQYFNYHKHSYYSNIITTDCVVSYDEYADRTKELGHKWLSCCEHGGTFAWAECYNIAKKHNLKFVCVGEFYFVEDRKKEFEIIGGKNKSTRRDNSNYHMVLIAKTQNAMRELNYIMSKAFEDGFYYKPRIDLELLRGLPKGEVYCTTACIAGFLRDYEKNKHILKELIDIFGDNLFLEVQCHNTESQIEYNKLLKNLSKEYGLKLIAGVDSHMISLDDTKLRDYLLHSKGIVYEDEQGWLNDYPSYNTLKDRFLAQGIWNEIEVENFIDNTLLLTNTDEIVINTKMKVPTIFPDKTREWRLGHLKELIFNKWNEYKNNFTKEEQELYYKELLAEYSVIEETKMEDYFLSNYYIIKRGKELGGVLTKTGRGCFVGDTQVWTTNGYKAIKDVKVGDIVINKNGEFDKIVKQWIYNIQEDLVKISFNNTNITLTKDHKILVYDSVKNKVVYKHSIDIDIENDYLTTPANKLNVLKYNDYEDIIDNYAITKIKNKEIVYDFNGFVYDLKIDKDPSFVVENICAHNSASSYLTNFMLGFTSVDRLQHKIPMLRERFMGKARIIDNNSSPDIDFNLWNRDAFIQAQDELLGYQGNYFMVAYGTLGVKSAFKMLCRAKEIPIETADEVSKLISAYEKDKKHNDSVELEDYIENKEYLNLVNASKVYTGIIDSFSVSPCSFILFNGDLRREIGLIRDKNGNMMTCITGVQAEKFGYLKNDLLIVKVVGMNHELYNRIGMEQPDSAVLEEWIKDDKNVWDLYGKGFTQCLNQVESSGTTSKCINYQPKTFEELCAFISVIRPASAGIYKSFESREDFKYNIKDVDNILRGEYLSGSWLIYQEQMMQLLQFLGFPDSEAYSVMKAISKKKEAVIEGIKSKFEENMTKKIIEDLLEKKGEN